MGSIVYYNNQNDGENTNKSYITITDGQFVESSSTTSVLDGSGTSKYNLYTKNLVETGLTDGIYSALTISTDTVSASQLTEK